MRYSTDTEDLNRACSKHSQAQDHGNSQTHNIMKWLSHKEMEFMRWLSGTPEKSAEEEKMDEMAAVVKTYRGLIEEDVSDEKKIWVDRPLFDIVFSVIIVLNIVVIGLEVDLGNSENRGAVWIALEVLFCCIFIAEIAFKVRYHTWRWIFQDVASIVATFIAFIAFIDVAILYPAGAHGVLRMFSLLRIIGLVRLRKLIMGNSWLEELQLVLVGVVGSIPKLIWTVVLCVVIVYISAVFLTKQIGHNVEDYGKYRMLSGGWDHEEYFGTVPRSMYSLFQCLTLDSWSSSVVRHVIANQWYMSFFFVCFVLLTAFTLLNIIVGVIAEYIISASLSNQRRLGVRQEKARKLELEGIREVFNNSDADGSGEIDMDEFTRALHDPQIAWKIQQLDLNVGDAAQLFSVIDGDGSRSLSITEFINGCTKLKGPAQSRDLLAIQAQADTLGRKMELLEESLTSSEEMMMALDDVTTRITKRFGTAVQSSRRKLAHAAGGTKPMVPPKRERPGGDASVPLSVGNRPTLPQFPDFLN